MRGFSVTFERFFPHEPEDDICEADESGFVIEDVTLREALRDGLERYRPEWCGPAEPDCYPAHGVRWLSFYGWNESTHERICEGISEDRALHIPDHVTEASRRRICRLFGVRT